MNKWDFQKKNVKKNGKRNCRPVFFLMFVLLVFVVIVLKLLKFFSLLLVVVVVGVYLFLFSPLPAISRHVKYILLEVYAFPLPLFLIHIIFQFINL